MGVPTRALQKLILFQRQRSNILNSKSQSVSIHPSSNIEPLTASTSYLSHSFTKVRIFCSIESTRWRATNVLLASKVEEQCV
jgi:hypothetical protein